MCIIFSKINKKKYTLKSKRKKKTKKKIKQKITNKTKCGVVPGIDLGTYLMLSEHSLPSEQRPHSSCSIKT